MIKISAGERIDQNEPVVIQDDQAFRAKNYTTATNAAADEWRPSVTTFNLEAEYDRAFGVKRDPYAWIDPFESLGDGA